MPIKDDIVILKSSPQQEDKNNTGKMMYQNLHKQVSSSQPLDVFIIDVNNIATIRSLVDVSNVTSLNLQKSKFLLHG